MWLSRLVALALLATVGGVAVPGRVMGQTAPVVPPFFCGNPQTCAFMFFYEPGWNLVAGTDARWPIGQQHSVVVGADGPLYTLQAGDTAYEAIPSSAPLQPGVGYWAYVDRSTVESILPANLQPVTLQLPAGQFVMIGNPFSSPVTTVYGADVVYIYLPGESLTLPGRYEETTTLRPGQGAWAYSAAGATISLTPFWCVL